MNQGHHTRNDNEPNPLLAHLRLLQSTLRVVEPPLTPVILRQLCREYRLTIHVAVLIRRFLNEILAGRKTIESRFTTTRQLPYLRVRPSDVLLLKQSAGPIRGVAAVSSVEFFGPLRPGEAGKIMRRFRSELRVDQQFIEAKRNSRYATLIHLGPIIALEPMPFSKWDRRPWLRLDIASNDQTDLPFGVTWA